MKRQGTRMGSALTVNQSANGKSASEKTLLKRNAVLQSIVCCVPSVVN